MVDFVEQIGGIEEEKEESLLRRLSVRLSRVLWCELRDTG